MEVNPLTNLSEIRADFIFVWDPELRRHVEIRDLDADIATYDSGNQSWTPEPSDRVVPGLDSMIKYVDEQRIGTYYVTNVDRSREFISQEMHHLHQKRVTQQTTKHQTLAFHSHENSFQRTNVTKKTLRPTNVDVSQNFWSKRNVQRLERSQHFHAEQSWSYVRRKSIFHTHQRVFAQHDQWSFHRRVHQKIVRPNILQQDNHFWLVRPKITQRVVRPVMVFPEWR